MKMRKHAAYVRILILTAISFGGLSGIYSFLAKSGELKILNDDTQVNIWGANSYSYSGIVCQVDQQPFSAYGYSLNCNNIAQSMANNITINPSWNCESKLSYSNLLVFENGPFLKVFIFIIIFAFISSYFTVIHDWRLIYYKTNLSKMIEWWPNDEDDKQFDQVLCGNKCMKFKLNINEETKKKCWWTCLVLILSLLCGIPFLAMVLTIAAITLISIIPFYLLIYPFYCCGSDAWHKFKTLNAPMCRISYMWIGVSKFGLMISTTLLTFYGFTGFSTFIREYYPNKEFIALYGSCKCYCHYVFPATNFYALMIVTYLLIFNTLFFFYQHGCKTMPRKLDYLLTKKYIVPINYITAISDDNDPTQTILYRCDVNPVVNQHAINTKDTKSSKRRETDTNDSLNVRLLGSINDIPLIVNRPKENIDIKKIGNKRKCLSFTYSLMFVAAIFWIILFTSIGFIPLGLSNQNGYPHWLAQLIMWIGIVIVSIITLCCALLCFCGRK